VSAVGQDGEPVGWIEEARYSFFNDRDARSYASLADVALDPRRVDYFRRYFDLYFNDCFRYGMGTEIVLSRLSRHGLSGSWLDVGCGTTTLFWGIPLTGVLSITCCDIVAEALAVLEAFADSEFVPRCYREVLELYDRSASDFARLRQRIDRYLVFDSLAPWPAWVRRDFDLITAFGNFGIAPDAEAYAGCLGESSRHLAVGGRMIVADWLRRGTIIARDGHDNSYLVPELVERAAVAAGLTILECEQVCISGDPNYHAILSWTVETQAPPGTSRCVGS
jgi:SAM-dependent methyltransferase